MHNKGTSYLQSVKKEPPILSLNLKKKSHLQITQFTADVLKEASLYIFHISLKKEQNKTDYHILLKFVKKEHPIFKSPDSQKSCHEYFAFSLISPQEEREKERENV